MTSFIIRNDLKKISEFRKPKFIPFFLIRVFSQKLPARVYIKLLQRTLTSEALSSPSQCPRNLKSLTLNVFSVAWPISRISTKPVITVDLQQPAAASIQRLSRDAPRSQTHLISPACLMLPCPFLEHRVTSQTVGFFFFLFKLFKSLLPFCWRLCQLSVLLMKSSVDR